MQLNDILRKAHEHDASDIHLIAGHVPMMRVHTVITPMEFPVITPETIQGWLQSMSNPQQKETFDRNADLDFSYEISGFKRYRVNAHKQRGVIGMALRAIRTKVPPLASLNLPEIISRLTYLPRGLVLVTGDTGYIWRRGALMLAISLGQITCSIGAVYLAARTAMGFGRDVRAALFHRVGSFSTRE